MPELSKTIVSNKVLQQNPMQPKEEKATLELPTLKINSDQMNRNASNTMKNTASSMDSMKKVDIMKVDSAQNNSRNEDIIYVRPQQEERILPTLNVSNQMSAARGINAQFYPSTNNAVIDGKRSEADAILAAAQERSFFNEIITHLEKENDLLQDKRYIKSDLLTKNLLNEMKAHWQSKKEEIKIEIKNRDVQEKIIGKIDELRLLEAEWQAKEMMIEEERKQLEFVEKMIEEKGYELKKTVRAARYSEIAKNPFFLRNGKSIKSINELLDVLKVLDNSTFNDHVNELRNDFSQWIHSEFKDEALAGRVKDAFSRDDLIAILEMF